MSWLKRRIKIASLKTDAAELVLRKDCDLVGLEDTVENKQCLSDCNQASETLLSVGDLTRCFMTSWLFCGV